MLARLTSLILMLLIATQSAMAGATQKNICSLFTAAEIGKLLGTAVDAGEPAAMDTGCQWFGKDETSYVIIQVVDAEFWIDPKQATGYEALTSVGKKAYSHPDLEGGWRAMALTTDGAVSVVAIGSTAKRASVVTLLRQSIERR